MYLDNIIILGSTFPKHVDNLDKVLGWLAQARMSLRLDKCHFFKNGVSYLGHLISEKGIKPQPEKVISIQEVSQPKTIRDVQSFLGLCNYYRKFVKDYAKIAAPLTKLLGHKNEKCKKGTRPNTMHILCPITRGLKVKSGKCYLWTIQSQAHLGEPLHLNPQLWRARSVYV